MLILLALLIGLAVGSFLNAAILRFHVGLPLWGTRSQCFSCRTELAWYDLLPVVSFVLLRRRCRTCEAPIDWQYPLVELITAALFVLGVFLAQGAGLGGYISSLLFWWFIFSVFIFLFVFDARFGELPDQVTLPAIAIAFIWGQFLGFNWKSALIGLAVGGGFFLVQHLVSSGRWVGSGDIRLGALLGVIVGWPLIVVLLAIAYVLGLVVSLYLLATGRKRFSDALPFGTFLIFAALLTIFFSPGLTRILGTWF